VVMGHDRHPLAPDNIENCQRVGLLERGDAGPRRLSDCGKDLIRQSRAALAELDKRG